MCNNWIHNRKVSRKCMLLMLTTASDAICYVSATCLYDKHVYSNVYIGGEMFFYIRIRMFERVFVCEQREDFVRLRKSNGLL